MFWLVLFKAGAWLAERVPVQVLYALGIGVSRILALIPSTPRARLRRNLAHVTGEPVRSSRLTPLVRSVFEQQAINYVDLMRSRQIRTEEIAARYQRSGDGWNAFLECVGERRGCVLVSPHFGRIEITSHLFTPLGVPIVLPVERLSPPPLFDLVCSLRAQDGVQLIAHDVSLRHCLRALSRGELVALFADWAPTGHGVMVEFFGAPARFPRGPAFIALRADVPVFVGFVLPGDGAYEGWAQIGEPLILQRTGDMDVDVARGMQRIAERFEQFIAMYPGRWVMFHELWPADLSEYSAPRALQMAAPR